LKSLINLKERVMSEDVLSVVVCNWRDYIDYKLGDYYDGLEVVGGDAYDDKHGREVYYLVTLDREEERLRW